MCEEKQMASWELCVYYDLRHCFWPLLLHLLYYTKHFLVGTLYMFDLDFVKEKTRRNGRCTL